jgi:hypothetical protein
MQSWHWQGLQVMAASSTSMLNPRVGFVVIVMWWGGRCGGNQCHQLQRDQDEKCWNPCKPTALS